MGPVPVPVPAVSPPDGSDCWVSDDKNDDDEEDQQGEKFASRRRARRGDGGGTCQARSAPSSKNDEVEDRDGGSEYYGNRGNTGGTIRWEGRRGRGRGQGRGRGRPPVAATARVAPQDNCLYLGRFRTLCGTIVNNDHVQIFVVALIAINSVMMGIATFPFVTDSPSVSSAFDAVDTAFLVVFTIELGMQFSYRGYRLFTDGWLVFDLVVIVTSWAFAGVQIIRAFRIVRALRLITRIKVMKNLVLALLSVIPRMFAIGLLLFLVSYIFAVMCTQLFADLYPTYTPDVNYWGRLDNTFFTLFQIMTLDNWSDIARQTMVAYPYAWLPIVVFVVVTGFVVVNLIIAVICDAISALHDDDKAKIHGNYRGDGDPNNNDDDNDDDDDNEEDDRRSSGPAVPQPPMPLMGKNGGRDVRDQLSALEAHVNELTLRQEETLRTLQALTSSLTEHRRHRRHRRRRQPLEKKTKKRRQVQRS